MKFVINILIGLVIGGVIGLIIWSVRHPKQAEEIRWLFPIRYYLSKLTLRRWTVNILGALLILWFANFYINWIQPALTPADLFPPEFTGPIGVKAWKANQGPVVNIATYTGTVEPYQSNQVYARVDGFVEKMYVYEGDYVAKGEVLAELDLSNIEPNLLKAIADSTFMAAELERAQNLFSNSAITASELDKIRKMYQQAAAQVKLMRAQVQYAAIRSGISGYVAERHIYPGQYVHRGEKLFRIDQLDKVRIKFTVSEADLPFIQPGDPVLLVFPQFSPPVFERHEEWRHRIQFISQEEQPAVLLNHGIIKKVSSSSPAAERGSDTPGELNFNPPTSTPGSPGLLAQVAVVFPAEDPLTRTGTVEVRLDNPNILLKSNGYVVGKFTVARVDSAIRVPSKAIVHTPDKRTVVFIAPAMSDQGFADVRDVQVGLSSPDFTQVLSGLEPGEYVVYAGMKDLVKGQSIQVLERKE